MSMTGTIKRVSMGRMQGTGMIGMGKHVSMGKVQGMMGMSNMGMDSSTTAIKRNPGELPPTVPMTVRQILPSKTWGVVVGQPPSRAGLSYGWKPRTLLLTRPGMGVNPSMSKCTRSWIRA